VYRDFNSSPEYHEYGGGKVDGRDYTRPDYYGQAQEESAAVAQPVTPRDPYASPYQADYAEYDQPIPYSEEQMRPYRMPADDYASDNGAEQQQAAQLETAEKAPKKKGLARLWAWLVAIGVALFKLKSFVFFLKFGWAGFTALFSIMVYSLLFGWPFAIGLVALLFIHEMGHALVMKIKGIPIGSVIFIPFLGAAVTMRQMPHNAKDEAEVGIAGPIAGAVASAVCLYIAQASLSPFVWAPLAYFGFFMNLFNLIPIVPFDGGRVLAAIDRRVWILGFVGLLAFQIWQWMNGNGSIWLLFFVVMAAAELWGRGIKPLTEAGKAYYTVPLRTRIMLSLLYFGLAAVLVLGMSLAHALIPDIGS